jgi:choice-of-anchor A domain-containing protein
MYRFLQIALIGSALANVASASYVNSSNVSGPLSGVGWNASAFNVLTLGVLAGNSYNEPLLAGTVATSSDIDGRVAAYGNLTNIGGAIGNNILGPFTDQYGAIVNGSSSTQNPYTVVGQAWVGTPGSSGQPEPSQGTVQTGQSTLDFNFTAARTALENYSVNTLTSASLNPVNLLAAPTPDPNHGNGYDVNVTGTGAVIVDLNPAYLTGNGLYITYSGSVTAVIFNVNGVNVTTSGSSLTINGNQYGLNYGGIPILFNFPNAQTLSVNNTFSASILAPFANLTSNANITGNIIVGQLGQTAELHDDYFSGTGIPSIVTTSTPEPMSFVLLGGGLIAIGTLRKRVKK